MEFNDIANRIIPGFNLLSADEISAFTSSDPGKQFSQFVEEKLALFKQHNSSTGWLSYIFGNAEELSNKIKKNFEEEQLILIQEIFDSEAYQMVVQLITIELLEREFPDFKLLDEQHRLDLAKDTITQQSFAKIYIINNDIIKSKEKLSIYSNSFDSTSRHFYLDNIDELHTQKRTIFNAWHDYLNNDSNMDLISAPIQDHYQKIIDEKLENDMDLAKKHVSQLADFFPLLSYRESTDEESSLAQILNKLSVIRKNVVSVNAELEEEHLTNVLFHCMRKINHNGVNYLNLDHFNLKQANHLAKAILDAFNKKTEFDQKKYLEEYKNKLIAQLIKNLKLIQGKEWDPSVLNQASNLWNSLSYHLTNSTAFKEVNQFIARMADAHAFIQATSFSTQNENSYLAILDLYNYLRYNKQIAETKNIALNLLTPLLPLYQEYKEISELEKNVYWKIFRTLMPIIITVAVIILVAAALVPLALPEIAFTAAFIPSLIIGLTLATIYVNTKNRAYKYLRESYYGGRYEIPEFQVSERMTGNKALKLPGAFSDPDTAQMVRNFYVDQFKVCDAAESLYLIKYKRGLLTEKEIRRRKENLEKRQHLSLEWYDIHSNKNLDYKHVPEVVLTRLHKNGDAQYEKLKKRLDKEMNLIHEIANELTKELKVLLDEHTLTDPEDIDSVDAEAPLIKINYTPGLFKIPRCKANRDELHIIDEMKDQIKRNIAI